MATSECDDLSGNDIELTSNTDEAEEGHSSKDGKLSRKAARRLQNFERIREAHKSKRRARKEERRKKKLEEDSDVDPNRPTKKELHQQIRTRMLAALNGDGPRVCIDLSMSHNMNTKEIHKLAGQVGRLYGSNRKAEKPFHMYLSSLDPAGQIYDSCVKRNQGFDQYLIDRSDQHHTSLFKKEEIVYLTPDSTNVLEDLDKSIVYIIGGLVDETPNKCHTLTSAKEHGIQTARLPIDEYMRKAPSGTYSKILTVNQVFDILLTLYNTNDWKKALTAGVPPRTGFVVR